MERRVVTPEKIDFMTLRKFDRKQDKAMSKLPEISLQNKIQKAIEKTSTANTRSVRREKVRPFLYDFLDEQRKLNLSQPRSTPWLRTTFNIKPRGKEEKEKTKIMKPDEPRVLSYKNLANRTLPQPTERIYKPVVIEFGPKSRMTLYSANNFYRQKPKHEQKAKRNNDTLKIMQRTFNLENSNESDKDVKDEESSLSYKFAMTYAEKVVKLQELADSLIN